MSDGGVCLIMFTVLLNVLGQAMWLTGHVYLLINVIINDTRSVRDVRRSY